MYIDLSKLDYRNSVSTPVTIDGVKHLSIKIPSTQEGVESIYIKLMEHKKKWHLLWSTYCTGYETIPVENKHEELNKIVLEFNKMLRAGFTNVIVTPKEKPDFLQEF
jgi:hypothetical protein